MIYEFQNIEVKRATSKSLLSFFFQSKTITTMSAETHVSASDSFGLYQGLLSFVLVTYTTFLCGVNYYTQVSSSICTLGE